MQQNTQTTNKKSKFSGLKYLLGLTGFILILWGAGIEDNREKMTPEQAKQELPSAKKTNAIIGTGAVSLLAAMLLSRKRGKDQR